MKVFGVPPKKNTKYEYYYTFQLFEWYLNTKEFVTPWITQPQKQDFQICRGCAMYFTTVLYCICIVTRGGIYNEIWPEPRGNPDGKAQGISQGLMLYFIVFPDSNHNTDILSYKSSIDLPGRSILEELIVRSALTAGQYGKILPSRLSNTGEVNFNIIMFSN